MPTKRGEILRACADCGAPFKPRHKRNRRCPRHETSDRSPTTQTRPSSSTVREQIRQEVLLRDPLCTLRLPGCERVSTVADHIVAAADGGRYEPSNLRGACWHCNSVRGGQTAHRTGGAERVVAVPAPAAVDRPALVRSRRLH